MHKLTLQTILSPSVFTVAPDTPLPDVLASMESLHISCVVAVDKAHRPVGIFTEQDAIRLMAERKTVAQLRMSDAMSASPLTASSNLDFRDAYRLISEKGFRHLIVVDDTGRVAGVVSEADFLQHMGMEYLIGIKSVSNAMTRNLISLKEDATLAEAVDLMDKQKISCVIVTRENFPVGILTERDAAGLARTISDPARVQIVSVMKSPVQTIDASLSIPEAIKRMESANIRRLVVVEDGILAGIVTRHDFVKTMQGRYVEFLHETLELQRKDLHFARKQIELTRQQLLYHSLMEQVNDAIIVLRAENGMIVDCNEQACRDLDYTRDELLCMTLFDFTTRLKSGTTWNAELEVIAREGHRLTETHHRRRDGSRFPVEIHARLIQKDNERYVVAVARDLTERKRAETQLSLQNAALNSTANAIVITDKDGIIEWANPAFSLMTGYALEEAIGKRPKELVSSGTHTREFYQAMWNTIVSGQVWRGEIVNKHKDGTHYTEEMTITPVSGEDKVITHYIAVKQNISSRKEAEIKLAQSETTFRGILNSITEAVYILGLDGRFIDVNHGAEMMYDYTRDELIGKTPEYLSAPEKNDLPALIEAINRAFSGVPQQFEFWGKRKDGSIFPKSVSLVKGDYFDQPAIIAVARDITKLKEAEELLRESAAVMSSTHEGVVITDTTPHILAVNDAYTTITGYTRDETIGKDPGILNSGRQDKSFYEFMWKIIQKDGFWQGEIWNRRKSGEIYPQWLSISAVFNNQHQPVRYIGVFSDITKLKESQSQLEFLAHHDPLTRLFNRSAVESRMEQELEQAKRHDRQLSVLFIDLDRFKQVNDSFGHLIGDELLCSVAERLRARLREGDTLGRLGGDEFVLLATPLEEKHDAAVIARDILIALGEPFNLSTGHEVFIGGSIGISLFPDNGSTVAELTKNADAAMYLAKENGRNQFSFYTPELNADARKKLELENDLRRAVMHNELRLHYQPKVNIRSGRISGAEALVRWKKADGGWISPAQFIPVAEKSGVILTIGNWVIEQACSQIRIWLDEGLPEISIAVNVSARQFRSGHLDKLVKNALEKFNISPHHLELELTESMLMNEPERAIDTMNKLKKVGVKISLDDFGTGYSNFGYLRRFPIDSLKIDQSFVRGVAIKPDDAMIVDSIIGLAQRMKLHVIAEGVETAEQLHYLRANHCDELQGYYFSKALPADEFADLLRSGKILLD
jgi:diguanylate cyclase (GGDEF)-like protein/PAS domain S-box-containing protein